MAACEPVESSEDYWLVAPVPRTTAPQLYELSPSTLKELNAIVDLEGRLVAANKVATAANPRTTEMTQLRAVRAYAIRALYDQEWTQAQIVSLLEPRNDHVVRSALHYGVDLPFGERPAGLDVPPAESVDWAAKLACTTHHEFTKKEAAGRTARAVRQDLVRALAGTLYLNLDLARMTGLSTAAIAQIRLGTANPTGNTGKGYVHELAHMLTRAVLGASMRRGMRYPKELNELLARWYGYTDSLGHRIVVAVSSLCVKGTLPRDWLVAAPVKSVLAAGWQEVGGYVGCDLPYIEGLGLMTHPGDEEFSGVPRGMPNVVDISELTP